MPNEIIGRIDVALGSNKNLRSGLSAYATLIDSYARRMKEDPGAAQTAFVEAFIDLAAQDYQRSLGRKTELLLFSDGASQSLYDFTHERTVLMFGTSRTMPPNSRDKKYHAGFPPAGNGYDRAHAISH